MREAKTTAPMQAGAADRAEPGTNGSAADPRSALPGPASGTSSANTPPSTPIVPFTRRITEPTVAMLVDDILPSAALLEFVSVDVLNCYINYVELRAVITERDPEEEERHISISNRFYTHFHEFGTVIHVVAASARHWWYFCYDIDASDCAIGRVEIASVTQRAMIDWVYRDRVSGRYPVMEIDVKNLKGWRSFQ